MNYYVDYTSHVRRSRSSLAPSSMMRKFPVQFESLSEIKNSTSVAFRHSITIMGRRIIWKVRMKSHCNAELPTYAKKQLLYSIIRTHGEGGLMRDIIHRNPSETPGLILNCPSNPSILLDKRLQVYSCITSRTAIHQLMSDLSQPSARHDALWR